MIKLPVIYHYFYPRPPGGGRPLRPSSQAPRDYFYPRPPGGGRLIAVLVLIVTKGISIHALRVEGDWHLRQSCCAAALFLSTPSGWRATRARRWQSATTANFYPRPPGGGRRLVATEPARKARFLSTPSRWRATAKTDKVFVCFCAKGRRICLFKTRKEKICR